METEVLLIALASKVDDKTGEISSKIRYGVQNNQSGKYGTQRGYDVMEDRLDVPLSADQLAQLVPLKPCKVKMATRPKRVADSRGSWSSVMAAVVVEVLAGAPATASAGGSAPGR
jgi:hypothetical protein